MTSTTTDAEQIRWQRDAVAVLGKLLELAARRGLPVISWTVDHAGARLVGHCYRRPAERRRAGYLLALCSKNNEEAIRTLSTRAQPVAALSAWSRSGTAADRLARACARSCPTATATSGQASPCQRTSSRSTRKA